MSDSKPPETSGLRVEGLLYSSQGFRLGPVDFRLSRGELLSIFGPNGAGKSTLLRVLAGLEPAAAGRIWLDDREITRLPAHQRDVGMVFQDLALFPQLSVWENLAYGPKAHRWSPSETSARVEELLREFHLEPFADRSPTRLSGGEQQRVALARALAPRPALLLFDEPLSAADREIRQMLQQYIRDRVATDRLVAVYVTHDLDEAGALATRMAFLRDGRWVEEGPAEEIRRAPRSRFVAEFLGFNVRRVDGVWVATEPSRTEVVGFGSPGSLTGRVQQVRQDGDLTHLSIELTGADRSSTAPVHSIRWSRANELRPGDAVGIRFKDEIRLSDE